MTGEGGVEPVELFGLRFPNRVGVAAGFDKTGSLWPGLFALGFGHVEIGTVTSRPQQGNPRPRLFRHPEEEAIVNRMGFNNDGADETARRLRRQFERIRPPGPLGINIGKSRTTPVEEAAYDYVTSFHALADFADYFTVNVSSPNTPGLRTLQEGGHLRELLQELQRADASYAERTGRSVPILVKIAPDLSRPELDSLLEALLDLRAS